MFYCVCFLALLFSTLLAADDELIIKRVNAHLLIGDYASAAQEALFAIQQQPDSKALWQTYLKALSKNGDEKLLMTRWRAFIDRFPEEKVNKEILECLSWAVIEQGATSSAPLIRVTAMLGAFFSQDVKGVAILLKGLRDDHAFLRAASIKLASFLHDATLQDEILQLLQKEKLWSVRLEAIKAVGEMRLVAARKTLMSIISKNNIHIEEKTAAIQALVVMSEEVTRKHLQSLAQSDRVGMRLLACELVCFYEQTADVDLLFPLLQDYHADVRAKVFETLGRLRLSTIAGQNVADLALKALGDPDPHVMVTAAWVLALHNPEKGQQAFTNLLHHSSMTVRHLASSALASSGKYGMPLMVTAFREETDAYVKMNLALGLIGQRNLVQEACDCLYNGLQEQKERWSWKEEGSFRILAPSKVKHDEEIPNYPEAVNQMTRLEVLQVLAIVHYSKAQQAVKNFLTESNWGISGLASALLLTEGDEEAVELVKKLMQDADHKVRVQAALILALWGQGEDVVSFLQEAYSEADRELKGQILEGIGRVGSPASLSFLVERLQEPFQTLRIIAAAAMLECLYH